MLGFQLFEWCFASSDHYGCQTEYVLNGLQRQTCRTQQNSFVISVILKILRRFILLWYNISKERMFFIKHSSCVVTQECWVFFFFYFKAVDSVGLDNHYRLQNVSENMIPTLYVHVLTEKQPICAFRYTVIPRLTSDPANEFFG